MNVPKNALSTFAASFARGTDALAWRICVVCVATLFSLTACGQARTDTSLPDESATIAPATMVAIAQTPTAVATVETPAVAVATASPAVRQGDGTNVPAQSGSAVEPVEPVETTERSPSEDASTEPVSLRVEVVASGLQVPRVLAFAPDGRLFVVERPERVRVIQDNQLLAEPALSIGVPNQGEMGILGFALAPDFAESHHVYIYHTYEVAGGLRNRVVRYLERDNRLLDPPVVIIDDIPGNWLHDGGLLAFGPDGKLYVTTGDVGNPSIAQDLNSLGGKILRLNPDGSIPDDNPFPGSPIYSYGHRNPQGLAWQQGTGLLYGTEHGETGNDEVNLIVAGGNYGWPDAQGSNHPAPFQSPLITYSPSVAPAYAIFYTSNLIPQWQDSFLFVTLRGSHLHRLAFDADDPRQINVDERLFEGEYGRLRALAQAPDGSIYVTTSNTDLLGTPRPNDDHVLRIVPEGAE